MPALSKQKRSEKTSYQIQLLMWYGAMYGAGRVMPAAEHVSLQEWERANLNGKIGTSDWPGWGKYIGERPVPQR